jgi:hypothetical protein
MKVTKFLKKEILNDRQRKEKRNYSCGEPQ